MKGADVYIVRFLPIFLFVWSGKIMLDAQNGYINESLCNLHSESAIYALSLFIISISNPKYHCVWNRAMYVELFVVPIINYIDSKFCIVPDAELYLDVLYYIWYTTLALTTYLAIRHFWKLNKKKICQTN